MDDHERSIQVYFVAHDMSVVHDREHLTMSSSNAQLIRGREPTFHLSIYDLLGQGIVNRCSHSPAFQP